MPSGHIIRLVALCLLATTTGCVKWGERTYSRFEVGSNAKIQSTPEPGVYTVKWAADRDASLKAIPESARVLSQATAIGFVTDEKGAPHAIAGKEQFAIRIPPEARYLVWSTPFRKEDRSLPGMLARGTLHATNFVLGATLQSVAFILDHYGNEEDEDEDDDWNYGSQNRHRDRRKGGGSKRETTTPGRGAVPWLSPPLSR